MAAELDDVSNELEECINATLPERKPHETGYRPRTVDWTGRLNALISLGYCRIEYRYAHPDAYRDVEYQDERRFREVAARAKVALKWVPGEPKASEEECPPTKR